MLKIVITLIASLIERLGWRYWQERKQKEANNAQNEVTKLPDAAVDDELRKWTKPE